MAKMITGVCQHLHKFQLSPPDSKIVRTIRGQAKVVLCLLGPMCGLWTSLQWRHNERDGVSNHQPHNCLLNRLFRRRSKKTSQLCVTGLYVGNSPVTGEFPAQRASNAENVSIWWRQTALLRILFVSVGGMHHAHGFNLLQFARHLSRHISHYSTSIIAG